MLPLEPKVEWLVARQHLSPKPATGFSTAALVIKKRINKTGPSPTTAASIAQKLSRHLPIFTPKLRVSDGYGRAEANYPALLSPQPVFDLQRVFDLTAREPFDCRRGAGGGSAEASKMSHTDFIVSSN